jgi:hypothetical protein
LVDARHERIPPRTLVDWRKRTHRERYERPRSDHEARIDAELAEDMLNLVRERVEAADLTHAKYREALERGDTAAARDLASADRNRLTSLGTCSSSAPSSSAQPSAARSSSRGSSTGSTGACAGCPPAPGCGSRASRSPRSAA